MEHNARIILAWLVVFAGISLGTTLLFCGATAGIFQGETCHWLLGQFTRVLGQVTSLFGS